MTKTQVKGVLPKFLKVVSILSSYDGTFYYSLFHASLNCTGGAALTMVGLQHRATRGSCVEEGRSCTVYSTTWPVS